MPRNEVRVREGAGCILNAAKVTRRCNTARHPRPALKHLEVGALGYSQDNGLPHQTRMATPPQPQGLLCKPGWGFLPVQIRWALAPLRPVPRMPEGPELHLASQYVNQVCTGLVFGGRVEKSAVSRNPEVSFESSAYHISAASRGKELRLTLCPLPGAQPPQEPLALVFRFGMSGSFQLAPGDALPPHAHLRFYTAPPDPQLALCFVDVRRFGRWDLSGQWQAGRGPCVLREYEQFR